FAKWRFLVAAEGNFERAANPELAVGVVAGENRPAVEAESQMPFRRITEPGLDGVIYLPDVTRVVQAGRIGGIESDVASRKCLQVPVAQVQFPAFDLLEQTDRGDVLVVFDRRIVPV